MRADLQRLKRDTESGRAVAHSSGPHPAVSDLPPQPATALSAATVMPAHASASSAVAATSSAATTVAAGPKQSLKLIGIAAALLILLIAGGWFLHSRQSSKLTEKDSVLLADFVNTTGDAVFDGTLKQALAVQLEQSPYLNIVPESKIHEALGFMGRSAGRATDERRGPRNMPASGHKSHDGGSASRVWAIIMS